MRRSVIQGMLVGAIVLDVASWSIWFNNRDWLAREHSRAYYEFENAFPLADLWLGLACLLALVTMCRGELLSGQPTPDQGAGTTNRSR